MNKNYQLWALLLVILIQVVQGALYGYTGQSLVSIDVESGQSSVVCDLSHLPALEGGSSSSDEEHGILYFYSIDTAGTISIVSVIVAGCKTNVTTITGLATGQNDVRDIKYDSTNNMLYMVFPNPFCMHGSLNQVNVKTGAVVSHLTNVIDPSGLSQTAGLDGAGGGYYFVGVPLGSDAIDYQLNKVALSTGNTTTVNLANNNIDVGDMWGSNYTLNVISSASGVNIVGAVSPSTTTVEECSPSGFYNINPTTGNVSCIYGPIKYEVFPLAELQTSNLYYYQLFNDASYNFFLYTFDVTQKKVVYTTPCQICAKVTVLAALP